MGADGKGRHLRKREALTLWPELGEDLVDDLAVHVGQPEVAAGVAIDQARVVDPHEVQDRGMIIVDVHGVGHDLDSVLVGGAVGKPSFHARTGQERRERFGVVVSTFGAGAVRPRRAAELGADGDQGLAKQPAP